MIIIWFIVAVLLFGMATSGISDNPTKIKQYSRRPRMSSSTYCGMKFRRSVKRRMRRW